MAINTVLLKGRGVRVEAKAGGAIKPGHIVRRNSAGALIKNNVAGLRVTPIIAVENDLEGKGIDDAYASGDFVQAEALRTGDWGYCFVPANAAAIVIGDQLTTDATGCLVKVTAASQLTSGQYTYTPASHPIATALDALDNSAVAAEARIRVEFM